MKNNRRHTKLVIVSAYLFITWSFLFSLPPANGGDSLASSDEPLPALTTREGADDRPQATLAKGTVSGADETSLDGERFYNAIYLSARTIDLYVDKTGNDLKNCTSNAKCLSINRALQVAPSIVRGPFGGINIHIGAGVYKEAIKLIGFPVNYGTRISFIGTFDAETGVPQTVIDNENTRDAAIQISKGVQCLIQDIKIINIKSNKYGISASDNVFLYLYNVHFTIAPGAKGTICAEGSTNASIYSRRSNMDGCGLGLLGKYASIIHAGYGTTITGTHTGSNSSALVDNTKKWEAGRLIGARINNTTDGSTCKITANTPTIITCTLTGGRKNNWDTGDSYTIFDGSDTYSNSTYAGVFFAENTTGHVDYSYLTGNNLGVLIEYESRADLVSNTFTGNRVAIADYHNSTLYEGAGNSFEGNNNNYDIQTGSTYGNASGLQHSVPCVVSTDCSIQTGRGYCCWNSSTNKLYFGNGQRAVEIGR